MPTSSTSFFFLAVNFLAFFFPFLIDFRNPQPTFPKQMTKARKTTSLLFLLALFAFLSLSSSLISSVSAQQEGGFDADAGGDFEPDIAGEPLTPLAPAVEDDEGEGVSAPVPPAAAAKKPAAPAPAPAAPTKKMEEPKKPAPAAAAAAAAPAKKKEEDSLPYADLLYTLLARRATFDPRSKKLTLEGVFPIVAAVKIGKGDGRGPTSLKAEGKDHECSALVSKTARRSSATRFFGDSFKRNGESSLGWRLAGAGARREEINTRAKASLSPPFFLFLFKKNTKIKTHAGTWLNSPTALLMGTASDRSGAELALRLSDVQYRSSASTVVFRAEQIDPATAKENVRSGEKTSLRSSGGVVGSWAALASSSGKWLDAKGNKVVFQDVILDVDVPYSRQEHQLKGFVEG